MDSIYYLCAIIQGNGVKQIFLKSLKVKIMANQTSFLSGAALTTFKKYLLKREDSKSILFVLDGKKEIQFYQIENAEQWQTEVPYGTFKKACEMLEDLTNAAWNAHKCKREADQKDCSLIAEDFAWEFGKQIGM